MKSLALILMFALSLMSATLTSAQARPGDTAQASQETGTSSATAAGKSSSGEDRIEDIVITAQRRSEDVQRAALAIDVIPSDTVGLSGATRATEIANLVPALQISESGNSQQSLYVRSVGTFVAQAYTDPAVAFNVDGVAIGRPSSMTGVLYDLQRVEVLKGPQGTLYGRNATGGAINVIPNPPKLGETTGEFALTAGNYNTLHPEGSVNLALTDSAATRLAFTYTRHSAYQSDHSGSENDYAGRAQYLYRPGDNLSVRLSADYAHEGGNGSAGTLVGIQDVFTGAVRPSPLPRDVGNQDPRASAILAGQYSFISGRFFAPIEGHPDTGNRFWGVSSEVNWRAALGTLTLLPAYRESKLHDFNTNFAFGSTAVERDKQTSVEARFASENEGLVRWLVGAYYFHENIDAIYQFNQQALAPLQQLKTGTSSKAGFARLTIAPIDELRFTAGLRYTDDKKSFDGVSQVFLSVCGAPGPIPACPNAPFIPNGTSFQAIASQLQLFPIIPGALYGSALPGAAASVFPIINKPIDQKDEFTKVTWHGGVEYDLSRKSLLYASWDTGYHAGGFAFAQVKPTYAPELLTAYAIGAKNRFFRDTLQLNVEAFYWHYTNQQISHGGTDIDGTYIFYTDNAGSSNIAGGELSLKYLITPRTVFNLDTQYLSAVYDRFTYRVPAGGTNPPPLTGCPFARTDATHYTIDCANKTAQHSPRWSGNVDLQHTVQVGGFALTGDINAHAQTASVIGFEMIPVEVQKAFAIGNASVSLTPSSAPWSLTAFVNNLTDRRPYGTAYYNSINGAIASGVGAPRTAGVRFAMRF